MASNGKGIDVRGEVVNLLVQRIATDRHPSVTIMNLVEELLAPDDVPAYVGVLMDKVQTERYPSLAMIHRFNGLYFIACPVVAAASRRAARHYDRDHGWHCDPTVRAPFDPGSGSPVGS
jgi:hypothetical protein